MQPYVKLYPPPGGWPMKPKTKSYEEICAEELAARLAENRRVVIAYRRQERINTAWAIFRLIIALIVLVICLIHFGPMGFVFFGAAFVVLFGLLPSLL